jgi:hypothetical protein
MRGWIRRFSSVRSSPERCARPPFAGKPATGAAWRGLAREWPAPLAVNCAPSKNTAQNQQALSPISHKISPNAFLSIPLNFFERLPSPTPLVRVEGMKTFSTLILLRQHRSLCLVSARLPG